MHPAERRDVRRGGVGFLDQCARWMISIWRRMQNTVQWYTRSGVEQLGSSLGS